MQRGICTLVAAAGFAAALPAHAAVTYDTSLASPPGVYFGSGNPNNHFTVNTTGGTELGLTTVQRFVGNYTPDPGTSVYRVPLGNTTQPGQQGSVFGFTFSLNDGPNSPTLIQITPTLSVLDELTGNTVTINPLVIPDNSGYGPAGKNLAVLNLVTDYAFQNSESLSFTNGVGSFFDPTYNSNANDTYIVTLSASCTALCAGGSRSLGSVSETIIAGTGAPLSVPEPMSAALLGTGVVALGFMRARRGGTRKDSVAHT